MRFFLYISNTFGKEEATDPAYVRSIQGAGCYGFGVELFFGRNASDIVFDFVQYIL